MNACRALLAAVLITTASVAMAAQQAPQDEPTATILCYHVVESPNDTKFSLTREAFRQQMNYLASAGYTVIPLEHLQQYLEGKRESLPRNSVVITVDDGWKCTYTVIYPELKQLKLPFTLFMYPKFVGQSAYALNWKEIREMSANGVDIQSHAFSHPFLTRRYHRRFDSRAYSVWLDHELRGSKKRIEKETGKTVKYLAYPYGDYDEHVVEAAREAGYKLAVTAEYGRVVRNSDPLRLRRAVIEVGTSFADFRRLVGSNNTLRLAAATPTAGSLFNEERPVISARIANFNSLDPNSVGMSLLSLGSAPYSYDPTTGAISMVVREPLKINRQQVVVWGRDKATGKRVEATWLFYASELPPSRIAAKAPSATSRATMVQAGAAVPISATIKAAGAYLGGKNKK